MRNLKKESYKQYIPDLQLAIERFTPDVPPDGKYYLLRDGKVVGVYASLKKAQEKFRQIVAESGFVPKKAERPTKSASEIDIERYMEAKELYWAESYRFRERGGKGGWGGV